MIECKQCGNRSRNEYCSEYCERLDYQAPNLVAENEFDANYLQAMLNLNEILKKACGGR